MTNELARAEALLADAAALFTPAESGKMLLYAGGRAGVKAEEIAGDYPEASGRPLALYYDRVHPDGTPYKSKFKSLKQQRKVFGLAKKGAIPFRRTGRLGASMTSEAVLVAMGVVIRVGTNDPGAKWTIGDEGQQSRYHAGTWTPLRRKIEARKDEILRVFSDAVRGYIAGYLKGRA